MEFIKLTTLTMKHKKLCDLVLPSNVGNISREREVKCSNGLCSSNI